MDNSTRTALKIFAEEATERLERINEDLDALSLSTQVDIEIIHTLFRDVHSLKSAANLVGMTPVEQIAHRLEDILDLIRNGIETPDAEIIAILEAGFTRIEEILKTPHLMQLVDVSKEVASIDSLINKRSLQR